MAKKRHYGSARMGMEHEVDRDVIEMGGQRGMMMQKNARHENAFGNMSFDPNGSAGFPTDVRMENYPEAGQFMMLDDNLAGHMGGIDRQMRDDAHSVKRINKPRRI
jgi:hypothetical protein